MSECAICFEPLQSSNDFLGTPCGHVFHERCLREWLVRSHTCPQCRCCTTVDRTRPLYLNFSPDDLTTTRNLESRIATLNRTLETRNMDLIEHRRTNEMLRAKTESQKMLLDEYETRINELTILRDQLSKYATDEERSKTEDAQMTLEWLKVREEKIRLLEESAKTDKEAHAVEMERRSEQQDKLMKELTARNSALETSKRKLEVDLQNRENEMEIQKQQVKLIQELTARCSALETSKRKLEIDLQKRENEIEIQKQQVKLIEELTARCSALETSKRKLEVDLQKRENEMEMHNEQDQLIEQLTARCSALETSKRQLESELETRVNELTIFLRKTKAIKEEQSSSTKLVPEEGGEQIATVQEARAVKGEPVPSTEVKSVEREKKIGTIQEAREVKEEAGPSTKLASGAKRAPRKVLSTIDLNSDTQAARRKQGHLKRLR